MFGEWVPFMVVKLVTMMFGGMGPFNDWGVGLYNVWGSGSL